MRRRRVALVAAWWIAVASLGCDGATRPVAGRSLTTPSGSAAATGPSSAAVTSANRSRKEDIPPEAATGYRSVDGVRSERSMVVAAHPQASQAGREMLAAGGSAVDAAVAMAAVLSLVEPQSSGIGGGAFLLHWDGAARQLRGYDGRETAPAAASPRQFLDDLGRPLGFRDAVVGGLSVGVPGELRMLELAHREHGSLPWKKLLQPAIELAEGGFAVSPRLHMLLGGMAKLSQVAPAGRYFYQTDGTPKPVGTVIQNPELAEVLRQVARRGAAAFYEGPIARDMVARVHQAPRRPGRLSLQDLKGYRAVVREPLCLPYRRVQICGMPPPSGGLTTLQILGLLERFDLASLDVGSVPAAHLLAEAGRLAFADRDRYVADPDFVPVPVSPLLERGYLQKRSRLIRPDRAMGQAAPGAVRTKGSRRWAPDASLELPSTSHLVAVDGAGNAVSMTASIESAFGSHLMVRGFLLNNELTDFSFRPERGGRPVANRLEPGKRPRSSMTPIIVLSGDGSRFVFAIGSPGGSRIIGYTAQTLVGVLDHQLEPQAAMARPHVVNRNGPTEIERHQGFGAWVKRTRAGLEALGHQVKVRDLNSGLHGILRLPDGSYLGGADPRREGVVLGD